jgi:hypothetical protein
VSEEEGEVRMGRVMGTGGAKEWEWREKERE